MKKVLFLFLIFLTHKFYGQEEKITQFCFSTSYSNGGSEIIIVKADSSFIRRYFVGGELDQKNNIARITSKLNWDKLINVLSEHKLEDLANLPAPTNYRAFDASTSTLAITTNIKTYNCESFDTYEPNKKLSKLTDSLLKIAVLLRLYQNNDK